MAYIVFVLMIVGLVCSVSAADCKSSTVGKEFVFGILDFADRCCHHDTNIIALDITNVSPNDTRIRLQIPFLNNDTYFDIPSGEKKTITISPSLQRDGTFKDSRGIKITSGSDIGVLVTNAFNSPNTIDTYNILPTAKCGNNYIISSHITRYSDYGSVFLAVGVKNNTNVTIVNGTSDLQSVILNQFEVFQYKCLECDLTGVRVISSENVFVVAGSTYTGIPDYSRDYIASEMLPMSTWSYNYIVAPVLPKSDFMIRIISESSFDVTISNITRTYRFSATSADQYFGTEALAVTATRPFSVTQYGVNYDYDGIAGDPFMAVVPAVEQYINNYVFTVPHGYYGNMTHYVAVIVPKINTYGLVLDGKSVQLYNISSQIQTLRVPAPFDNYTILTFTINEGYHRFYHSSQMVNFGVFVYGHGLGFGALSRGFYAGFNLKGDCSTTSTASTATTPTTSTSSTLPQSTSTHTQSTTPPLSSLGKGPTCYKCDDLTHVGLCDTVHQCALHEVCYIERYMESGQVKYISGCLEADKCPSTKNESRYPNALCFECCHGDFCNNKGCGENGIPDRESRGPICFDCQHVASPDECLHVTPCDSHQECSIEEFKWFDYSLFKLGCGHVLCHPTSRMGSHVFKRATPVCHSCCTGDYCNRNCTTSSEGQTGSVIIG